MVVRRRIEPMKQSDRTNISERNQPYVLQPPLTLRFAGSGCFP